MSYTVEFEQAAIDLSTKSISKPPVQIDQASRYLWLTQNAIVLLIAWLRK